jgi:hypothetical protein
MQAGVASFNRNRSAALIVGFDVEDYHLEKYAKYVWPTEAEWKSWLNHAHDEIRQGYGRYMFRVK